MLSNVEGVRGDLEVGPDIPSLPLQLEIVRYVMHTTSDNHSASSPLVQGPNNTKGWTSAKATSEEDDFDVVKEGFGIAEPN